MSDRTKEANERIVIELDCMCPYCGGQGDIESEDTLKECPRCLGVGSVPNELGDALLEFISRYRGRIFNVATPL